MARVLVPRAASAFSALGLLTADHVIDATRTLIAPWQSVDLDRLNAHADALEAAARDELRAAGVGDDRIDMSWLLNLVYPGQTFDNGIPIERRSGRPIDATEVAAAVEEFHRRNEAARLIEARAQEPTVRGIRLVATGRVPRPNPVDIGGPTAAEPIGHRRVHVAQAWHDAGVHDLERLGAGATVVGPAVVQSRFTTLVLRPGDRATVRPNGDVLVDVA